MFKKVEQNKKPSISNMKHRAVVGFLVMQFLTACDAPTGPAAAPSATPGTSAQAPEAVFLKGNAKIVVADWEYCTRRSIDASSGLTWADRCSGEALTGHFENIELPGVIQRPSDPLVPTADPEPSEVGKCIVSFSSGVLTIRTDKLTLSTLPMSSTGSIKAEGGDSFGYFVRSLTCREEYPTPSWAGFLPPHSNILQGKMVVSTNGDLVYAHIADTYSSSSHFNTRLTCGTDPNP